MPVSEIRYVSRKDLDEEKYDRCIDQSTNGLLYAKSFFLDHMAVHWGVLVAGDYEEVFPITWNRKFRLYYIYQPYFTRQLGVFFKEQSSTQLLGFLNAIPGRFRYWDFDFNESNLLISEELPYASVLKKRRNNFLDLALDEKTLSSNFSRLAKRNIQRSINADLQIATGLSADLCIDFYIEHYNDKQSIPAAIYSAFRNLVRDLQSRDHLVTYAAQTSGGETLAVYLLFKDNRYLYSILGGSNEQGKNKGAFYRLTSEAICRHAGSGLLFRFEGSDHKGINFFNRQFGGYEVNYFHIKRNRLPWPVSMLKR